MHGGSISPGEIKKMFSSHLVRVKVTEEIFVKLRSCIASNPSIKNLQHVHQFERDAIKVLFQQNPSESVQSQACALVEKMQDLFGVKLTSEFDSDPLQSADAAPSSSSTGKHQGMVWRPSVAMSVYFIFSNHSTKNNGTFLFYTWRLRKL